MLRHAPFSLWAVSVDDSRTQANQRVPCGDALDKPLDNPMRSANTGLATDRASFLKSVGLSRSAAFFFLEKKMHLLYLDESGNPDDPTDRYFVMAGVAVFERVTFFLSRDVDALQQKVFSWVTTGRFPRCAYS